MLACGSVARRVLIPAHTFNKIMQRSRSQMHQDERGTTSVEYALLVTFIAAGVLLALTVFGTAVSSQFDAFLSDIGWG
jgi:Flp pilus assembly pilin Flp